MQEEEEEEMARNGKELGGCRQESFKDLFKQKQALDHPHLPAENHRVCAECSEKKRKIASHQFKQLQTQTYSLRNSLNQHLKLPKTQKPQHNYPPQKSTQNALSVYSFFEQHFVVNLKLLFL